MPMRYDILYNNGMQHVADNFSPKAVAPSIDEALRELGVPIQHNK